MSTREALARVFAGPKDDLGLGCSESVGKPSPPHGVRYSPCGRPAGAYVAPPYDLDRPVALCKLHTTLAIKRGARGRRLVTDDDRRAAEQRRWDAAYAIALSRVDNILDSFHDAGYEVCQATPEPPDSGDGADRIDAAWAAAEAALPEGWEIAKVTRVRLRHLESMQRWGAQAAPIIPTGRAWRAQHVTRFGDGSTPAVALRELASALRAAAPAEAREEGPG